MRPIRAPYATLAVEEAFGLITALGGDDRVSEQRIALVQDVARAGLLMRALMAQMLQQDADRALPSHIRGRA